MEIDVEFPGQADFMWPTLMAFRGADGPLTNGESVDAVIDLMQLSEEQQAVPHRNTSLAAYRVAWARTNLKGCGLLENPARALWEITTEGREVTEAQMHERLREMRTRQRSEREARAAGEVDADTENGTVPWQDAILATMRQMDPYAFERLFARILRQSQFTNVQVTGGSGDGGLDGIGVYRVSLVSFRIYFQCKRYTDAVRASAVRDFRGAMAGRGEKGLLITTSHFTRDAEREAERDGAPPVELVDGQRLCQLLLEHRIGLTATERVEYDVTIDHNFFANL